MKTIDDKNQFVELRAKGYSFDKISKKLNISKSTLIEWSKDMSMELANAKAMFQDMYVQKFVDLEKKKAEKYFKIYERLLDQILEKDVSKEPLHKIIESLQMIEAELEKYQSIELKRDNPESIMRVEFNTIESWSV